MQRSTAAGQRANIDALTIQANYVLVLCQLPFRCVAVACSEKESLRQNHCDIGAFGTQPRAYVCSV